MPHFCIRGCVASVAFLISTAACAGDAGPLINFFIDQAAQEIDRQDRLERQGQIDERNWFAANWQACGAGDIPACDEALRYPKLSRVDRKKLTKHRAALVEAQKESLRVAEQERLDAERREKEAAERANAEAQAATQNQISGPRLIETRGIGEDQNGSREAFLLAYDGCRHYAEKSCEIALSLPNTTPEDRSLLLSWQTSIFDLKTDIHSCQLRLPSACDKALASPALAADLRPYVERLRSEIQPSDDPLITASIQPVAANKFIAATERLPLSTIIFAGIALLLAGALAWTKIPWPARAKAPSEKPSESKPAEPAPPPPKPETAQVPAVDTPRDTPGAIAALELAHAYLDEVKKLGEPNYDDAGDIKRRLNTLSLAAKQLDTAERLDPDAILDVGEGEQALHYRLNELKSDALRLEGSTHPDPRKALSALKRATAADPENAVAFYSLGMFYAGGRNKPAAVAALKRAVELYPKSIEFRMELDRVQNLSPSEIASFRVARAGIRTYNAGIRTANVFITAWNVFAIVWRIVFFPVRVALWIGGHR